MKNIELIDNLTSIGNSLYLYQNYHEYMKQYENVQLIMIDLEKFKQINDSFGHNIGDLYLKVTAKLLTKNSPNSFVARIHGDEFIVLTYYNEKEIEQTFLVIEEEIQELVRKEIIPVLFRLTAGSSLFDANNIDSSKEKADLMMYIAKSNGSFYQAFSEYDWQLNEREKKVLIQFDNLLKEKRISYEKRQLFTIDKKPQNLYQIHTRDQDGASFLNRCYDNFLRKNKRQYQLDEYNLRNLKNYFADNNQNYIIDLDYLSLLKNRKIITSLEEYSREINVQNIVISIKFYPETNQDEFYSLINKINYLKV